VQSYFSAHLMRMSDLNYRRMINAAIMAVRISSVPEHSMRTTLTYTEEYDNYDVRSKLTKPNPLRALDACASLNFDLQKEDMLTLRRQSSWMTETEKNPYFTSMPPKRNKKRKDTSRDAAIKSKMKDSMNMSTSTKTDR
jgi:hypothetical protein